jgi:glycosyltransferase involved in cell wall biosynthesis
MKVLLFSNLFPIPREPSRGVFVAQLAEALRAHASVHALVPLPWVPGWPPLRGLLPPGARPFQGVPASYQWGQIEASTVRYPMIPGMGRAAQARSMARAARRAAERLHREITFDLVNAHWLDPDGVAAVDIARDLGLPLVLSARGCDVNLNLTISPLRDRVLDAVRAAAAVTTVSGQLKAALVGAGIDPSHVTAIPNGVDTTRFFPADQATARTTLGIPASQRLIVCVSRLSEEKGVDTLVEAMAHPAVAGSGATLALVGDGPMRDALAARVAALGLGSTVQFVGAVAHEAVPTWFAAADLCCLPSLREGYPNVVLEALACGRPMVASRVGAIPDMVGADAGVLVEPGSVEAMAEGLSAALARAWDPRVIAQSVSGLSWERSAAAYAAVFRRVAESA